MRKCLAATGVAVASILIAPTSAFADLSLDWQLSSALWNITSWLQRLTLRLAVPVAIVGAILLMLGQPVGRRILWGTVLAVAIALFAVPLLFALPGIVHGATIP